MRWLAILPLTGCIVVTNDPPDIRWAEVTCGFDPAYRDWVWTFEAEVYDDDDDVRFVDAHVYDDWTDEWVDSFALEPDRGELWFSAWTQISTALYCGDPYTIDFVAEDGLRSTDLYTVQIGDWWTP